MEISLKKFMELWEQRNQDVHGKTEAQQQSRQLQKLRIEIRKLHDQRDQTRPSDDFIFHDDLEGFLETTTTTRAANYISSTKRIILHSVAAAAKAAVNKTKNILDWFKPVDPEGINRIRKRKHYQLVHDAFSKKKKRKLKRKIQLYSFGIDNHRSQDIYRFSRTSHNQITCKSSTHTTSVVSLRGCHNSVQ